MLVVDGGGYFPEDSLHIDSAPYLMSAMRAMDVTAVAIGDRDVRFGLGYLVQHAGLAQLPLVCANLTERRTHRPVAAPFVSGTIDGVKVGVFGLITPHGEFGRMKDSVIVTPPVAAARRAVTAMRAAGATVVVLLSQLGQFDSEQLVQTVPGIDAAVVGWHAPMLEHHDQVGRTVMCYAGEQGQEVGRTTLGLDATGHATVGISQAVVLGPEVKARADVAARTQAFETAQNQRMNQWQAAHPAPRAAGPAEQFVGAAVCARCHAAEAAQWGGTAHARAWRTLENRHKDADPDCIRCHVVAYRQPTGFESAARTPGLANVQCESCHGFGSGHEVLTATHPRVGESVCRTCHTPETSPAFTFEVYAPHVAHHPTGALPPLPPKPAGAMSGS